MFISTKEDPGDVVKEERIVGLEVATLKLVEVKGKCVEKDIRCHPQWLAMK